MSEESFAKNPTMTASEDDEINLVNCSSVSNVLDDGPLLEIIYLTIPSDKKIIYINRITYLFQPPDRSPLYSEAN